MPGAPILSDRPGSFPWTVLHDRHPALLKQVLDGLPYPPDRRRAVGELAREITGVIEPLLDDGGDDVAAWAGWASEYLGRSWFDVPFLWAESYFYRKLLAAVGYLSPGVWHGIDPFGPVKDAELAGPIVDQELLALDRLPGLDPGARADALLLASLWGNRADLGFLATSGGTAGGSSGVRQDRLVADDRALLWGLVDGGEPGGRVIVVADNAGRELLPDLVLVDHLLSDRRVAEVVLHVKVRPAFVSDAILADVLAAVRRLIAGPVQAGSVQDGAVQAGSDESRSDETGTVAAGTAGSAAGEIGQRLWAAMGDGRLIIRADPFSIAPLPYQDLPDRLRAEFAAAKLTIMKGDLNYRRLVGDQHWPATDSFAERTAYFPGPVVALRTLKSEVIVGLSEPTVADLDATGTPWRTSGSYGLIQARA